MLSYRPYFVVYFQMHNIFHLVHKDHPYQLQVKRGETSGQRVWE